MSRNIASLSLLLALLISTLIYSVWVSALSSLGTDFVGSTTNSDFIFYANNTERMRITPTGYVRISTGYLDYRPGGIGCTTGQVLAWDNTNTRWICSNDSVGISGSGLTTNYVTKWNGTAIANSLIFDSGTGVGIGTASPMAQLHVVGNTYLTGGNIGIRTSIPDYGITVLWSGSGGMISTQSGFCINGTCINTWQGLNNIVTSTGNPNYLAKFGATGALSNSQIYETGSKLYIGDVPAILAGTATSAYGYLTIETFGTTNSSNPFLTLSENGGQECRLWISGANKIGSNCVWWGGTSGYSFAPNTVVRSDATGIDLTGSLITDNGTNVGIGNTSPDLKFLIADTTATNRIVRVQRGTQAADGSMVTGYGTPYLNIWWLENRVNSLQTIGFGYNSFGGTVRYAPAEIGFLTTSVAGNTQGDIVFANRAGTTNVAPTETMRITSTGAVGIGTTTPGAKLQVTGTMKIVDGSQGAGKVLTSDASGLASWTTPSGGTFLIPAPLYSYRVSTPQATTLATAVDVTSLVSGDLPIGVYSFKSIIKFRSSATVNGIGLTLNQNTATIADLIWEVRAQRTAILNDPVSITTPGTMVVGTAVNAANTDYFSEIEGTFQVTATGSVKIQFRSEVATNTTTVQTGSYLSISPLTSIPNVGSSGLGTENYVSKFDALGWLANSVMFDNGTNVGIGTITPGARLEVAGTVKIVDGSQGAGKVLTSDATGLATWATPSGWGLTGNAGTTAGTNFLGTTDNVDVVFKRNNVEVMRLSGASGNLVTTADATINGVKVGRGGGNVEYNTANGYIALVSNTTGQFNTANGYFALLQNTTGGWNTALGSSTLYANTSGNANTAIGNGAISVNTTGSFNSAIGDCALCSNWTGSENTAIGARALVYNTSGSRNVANGLNALQGNITWNDNVSNWYNALRNVATGSYNIANGSFAWDNLTSGNNNIAIGYNTNFASSTASNQLNIGDWIYGTSGNIGIGTGTALTAKLTVAGQVQITGGSPGAGKVLTSDATGLATWQSAGSSGWGLTGNAGTIAGTNFLGTTDNVDVVFKRNNVESMRLSGASGNLVTTADATINGVTVGRGGGPGYQNTAMGNGALYSNIGGGNNTTNGYGALYSNTSGWHNTAIGVNALYWNISGSENTAIGLNALTVNTNSANTAVGSNAMAANISGYYNTAVWRNAMATNTTGTHNTANGMGALGTNTGGALNTANGMEALQFNTTGSNNVAVGADAMESNTIGSNNVALGESALRSNTTGSNNIAIGRYADVASSTGSNQLSIGNWIYGTNGNIGVGTNAPTNKFQVNGSSFLGGGSFELRDAGVVDSTAVRLFSAGGNLYLQNGAGDNIVFRGKTGAATMTLSNAGFLNVSGNIRNSNPSVGYLELSWDLPWYATNTYPTLKTNAPNLYFSVGWAYSAYMSPGWVLTAVSDRAKKENFQELNFWDILNRIDQLPMTQWNYKSEDKSIRHIAPIAQDFYNLFHLNGSNDKMISSIDPSGVALAGIKWLIALMKEAQSSIADLKTENARLRSDNDTLNKRLNAIEARLAQ